MRATLPTFALVLACGSTAPSSAAPPREDEPLVAALRRAASDRVSLDDAESVVGHRAILMSHRDPDRDALQMVDLAPDALAADCPSAGDLSTFADAAYWGRGSDDAHGNPRVVGLRWLANGDVEVFCSVVLPP